MGNLLIIIDMQEGFRYKESEAIVPKLKNIVENFKGVTVFTCFKNNKNSKFEKDRTYAVGS